MENIYRFFSNKSQVGSKGPSPVHPGTPNRSGIQSPKPTLNGSDPISYVTIFAAILVILIKYKCFVEIKFNLFLQTTKFNSSECLRPEDPREPL